MNHEWNYYYSDSLAIEEAKVKVTEMYVIDSIGCKMTKLLSRFLECSLFLARLLSEKLINMENINIGLRPISI